MKIICPTITVEDGVGFNKQFTLAKALSNRVHLDLADGVLAPRKLIDPAEIETVNEIELDVHCMYMRPDELIAYFDIWQPSLVIVHAEAHRPSVLAVLDYCVERAIKFGLAILPDSDPKHYHELLEQSQHCLIFGGRLGYQGSEADLNQLAKVELVLNINPMLEVAWDGGVNQRNIAELSTAGVEVFNVGSFIQNASDPQSVYQKLSSLIQS